MKHLVFFLLLSQVATVYPLCHSLLTTSSCLGSSPPGTVFGRLKITNITSGLFITKPHGKSSSALHALSQTHTHNETRRMTDVALKTNKSEAGRGIKFWLLPPGSNQAMYRLYKYETRFFLAINRFYTMKGSGILYGRWIECKQRELYVSKIFTVCIPNI